jgi:hypothetical protein
MKMTRENIVMSLLFIGVITVAVIMRLVPHVPNFTPIGALALFSGAIVTRKFAFMIPFAVMVVSDLFIGTHSLMIYTWGSFLLIGVLGYILLRRKVNLARVVFASLAGSFSFYVITNFGVWLEGWLYPMTFNGLVQSYVMAIPFFRNMVVGDLFYSGMFFGSYLLVKTIIESRSKSFAQ